MKENEEQYWRIIYEVVKNSFISEDISSHVQLRVSEFLLSTILYIHFTEILYFKHIANCIEINCLLLLRRNSCLLYLSW